MPRSLRDADNRRIVAEGRRPAEPAARTSWASPRRRLATDSWLSAASFQETTRVLTDAAIHAPQRLADRPQGERHHRQAHPGGYWHQQVPQHPGGADRRGQGQGVLDDRIRRGRLRLRAGQRARSAAGRPPSGFVPLIFQRQVRRPRPNAQGPTELLLSGLPHANDRRWPSRPPALVHASAPRTRSGIPERGALAGDCRGGDRVTSSAAADHRQTLALLLARDRPHRDGACRSRATPTGRSTSAIAQHGVVPDWLCAAHTSEAADGRSSWARVNVTGPRLVIVRGEDEQVRAFFNASARTVSSRGWPVARAVMPAAWPARSRTSRTCHLGRASRPGRRPTSDPTSSVPISSDPPTGALRRGRAATASSAAPTSAPDRVSPFVRRGRAGPRTRTASTTSRSPTRRAGRRALQPEARAGEQPRVLPLRRVAPPRAARHAIAEY